jgi:hypothetical protein
MSGRHIWYSDSHTVDLRVRLTLMGGARMLVYEDNYGFSNLSGPEERAFFDFVRRQSVLRTCERCERPVRLIPPKALCASCTSALEYGAPILMKEYGSQETFLDPARPS